MKALTLQQPWAYAIAQLGKRIENRTWPPPADLLGQALAIHAGLTLDGAAFQELRAAGEIRDHGVPHLRRGVIVAVVRVGGVIHDRDQVIEIAGRDQLRWYAGRIGWHLSACVPLPQPVPCTGAQKVWTVPEYAYRRVVEQMAAAGGLPT